MRASRAGQQANRPQLQRSCPCVAAQTAVHVHEQGTVWLLIEGQCTTLGLDCCCCVLCGLWVGLGGIGQAFHAGPACTPCGPGSRPHPSPLTSRLDEGHRLHAVVMRAHDMLCPCRKVIAGKTHAVAVGTAGMQWVRYQARQRNNGRYWKASAGNHGARRNEHTHHAAAASDACPCAQHAPSMHHPCMACCCIRGQSAVALDGHPELLAWRSPLDLPVEPRHERPSVALKAAV